MGPIVIVSYAYLWTTALTKRSTVKHNKIGYNL